MIASGRLLPVQDADLHVEVLDLSAAVLQCGRRRGLAKGNTSARRVQQTYGLIRKLPIGDVAVRQFDRVLHSLVEDANLVMFLQSAGQAAYHLNRQGLVGLLHLHHLEATLESSIGLEEFLVLGPGRGRNGTQFTAGQGRLE